MTKGEIIQGLYSGKRLRVDRKDEPLLPWLFQLCQEGALTYRLLEFDQQSSAFEFTAKRQ